MKPRLDRAKFGSITIDGKTYNHDVLISLKGEVIKRKKKLSKAVYGSSHTISLGEAKFIYEEDAIMLIFGTGQYGMANLSEEAEKFFKDQDCKVEILPTPEAIKAWNQSKYGTIGLFHITC